MDDKNIENIIESILFASGDCVTIQRLCDILGVHRTNIINCIEGLIERYKNSAIQIVKLDDGYQMCTVDKYYDYIKSYINTKKNTPISNASVEVLAIVAYNQPVTKGFIEQIRGVDSSYIVNTLVEKRLLKENGRLNLPGRPISYKTTENFLRCFNLGNLNDLPNVNEHKTIENLGATVLENQLTL